MRGQSTWGKRISRIEYPSIRIISRIRKPLALGLSILLCAQGLWPALAAEAADTSRAGGAPPPISEGPAAPPPAPPSVPGSGGQSAATSGGGQLGGGTATGTALALQAFQNDLFTGTAAAEIPIALPPGTAGVAPKVTLRYNSGNVDDLRPTPEGVLPPDQAPWTGLGWTLEAGGYISRDTHGTLDWGDDTWRLVLNGASYELALVDSNAWIWHTKDETFWKLQYVVATNSWTLWTKDGTVHQFGTTSASRAQTYNPEGAAYVYKYCLDTVQTPTGTGVHYTYTKQTATSPWWGTYDQAIYPDTITYTSLNGNPIGSLREVRFVADPTLRTDYTDTTPTTKVSHYEKQRLQAIEVRVGTSLVRK